MAAGTWVTTALIKTWLGITGAGDDGIFDRVSRSAEMMIENKLGISVVAASGTRYYHAVDNVRADGADLMVDYHTALTSVTNGDGTSVATGNIQRLPINGTFKNRLHLKGSSGLTWNYSTDPVGAITVVANWGLFSAANVVTEDLTALGIEIGGWLYRVRDTSMGADILAQTRSGTILMPGNMPANLVSRLNRLGGLFN